MSMRTHQSGLPRLQHATLYMAMLVIAPAAHAARLDYTLGASILHSDNIGLNETNEVSDTVVSPELTFNVEQAGSVLQFLAEGDIRYPHYVDETFDDELQGSLAGTLNWNILPERISFQATDNLSRQSVNVLNNEAPDNQQQVNVFTAGPSIHARFNEATSGQLEVLYTNTYAQESTEFQGDRYSAEAMLERRISSTDQLTFTTGALQTHYDEASAFFDYTRYDAIVGYVSRLASVDIELEGGYSQIRPKNYRGDSSSPLFRANVEWRVTPRTKLSTGVLYEFSDAAQNLVIQRSPPTTGFSPVVVGDPLDLGLQIGPQTFRQRRVTLGYQFTGERLTIEASPYYDRIRYLTAGLNDQDVKAVTASLNWRLRPRLELGLAAGKQERTYYGVLREDDSTYLNLTLNRQLSRNWIGRIGYLRTEVDSSSPLQSYVENRTMLSIIYRR